MIMTLYVYLKRVFKNDPLARHIVSVAVSFFLANIYIVADLLLSPDGFLGVHAHLRGGVWLAFSSFVFGDYSLAMILGYESLRYHTEKEPQPVFGRLSYGMVLAGIVAGIVAIVSMVFLYRLRGH